MNGFYLVASFGVQSVIRIIGDTFMAMKKEVGPSSDVLNFNTIFMLNNLNSKSIDTSLFEHTRYTCKCSKGIQIYVITNKAHTNRMHHVDIRQG